MNTVNNPLRLCYLFLNGLLILCLFIPSAHAQADEAVVEESTRMDNPYDDPLAILDGQGDEWFYQIDISEMDTSEASTPKTALDLNYSWNFSIQNDMRFDVYRVPEKGFSRNESLIELDVKIKVSDNVQMVGDIKTVWTGFSKYSNLEGMTLRSEVDPWRIESDAAFVELLEILPNVDIRIGRQTVQWGSALMFNPTDNVCADDLEDKIQFGENIGNEMILINWYAGQGIVLSAVWVPVFRSAMLPKSSAAALEDVDKNPDIVEDFVLKDVEFLRNFARKANFELLSPIVHTDSPDFSLKNSQFGIRVLFNLFAIDFSASYYYGFDDVPVPYKTVSVINVADQKVYNDAWVTFPRMHVLGIDMVGDLKILDGLGYWVEAALFFPEEMKMQMFNSIDLGASLMENINHLLAMNLISSSAIPLNFEGTIVSNQPYAKVTVGLEYMFNEHVFITVQYLRGFTDDFSYQNMGNYLVAGSNLNFFSDRMELRLFAIMDMDFSKSENGERDRFSALLFPELILSPFGFADIHIGGLVPLGARHTKFGQAAIGAATIFFKVRLTY